MRENPLRDPLLRAVGDEAIVADTMEEGLDVLAGRLPTGVCRVKLAEAVQSAVAAGLLYEPVRLPPGALQCHWHLELTPAGKQALRTS